jgi:hypothetical protein
MLRHSIVTVLALVTLARAEVAVWEQRTPANKPPARRAHAAAYDTGRQRTVVFGGQSANNGPKLADTWEWNGTAWFARATPGPQARDISAMAYDAARRIIVLFGGLDAANTPLADTWTFDGAVWRNVNAPGPPARSGHAMAFDEDASRVLMFGGIGQGGTLNDFWEFDGVAWTPVPVAGASPRPAARAGHAMAWDASRRRLVVYGGLGVGLQFLSDTWEYQRPGGRLWEQRCVACAPGIRVNAAMTYNASRARTVLHGGLDPAPLADGWLWDGASWTMIPSPYPSPRAAFPLAYDSVRMRTVLFGGWKGMAGTEVDDTWELFHRGYACTQDAECPTRFCRDGVCCANACTGLCRRCDELNAGVQDGVCRSPSGKDPDADCAAELGKCNGNCTADGQCRFDQAGTKCGLCAVCNSASGKCDTLPPGGVDAACPAIACGRADNQCRDYHDAHVCMNVGTCAKTIRWANCPFTNQPDGTLCNTAHPAEYQSSCAGGLCQYEKPFK